MGRPPQQTAPKSRDSRSTSDTITDPRFTNIQIDPRFRLPSRRGTQTTLDSRFAHVLHDAEFSRRAKVDRYGRRLKSDSTKRDLERFYRVEPEKQIDSLSDPPEGEDATRTAATDVESLELIVDDDEEVRRELRRADRYDPARDGGFSSSSGEEDDEESEEEDDNDDRIVARENEEGLLPEIQIQGTREVPLGDVSSRLAVVNLDWDHIRAVDLLAVFSSFCPSTIGRIARVGVYPSEFGRERMDREEMDGPPREIFASSSKRVGRGEDEEAEEEEKRERMHPEGEEDEEEEEKRIKAGLLREDKGEEFNSSKLRHYQLERLRYYYAVLWFSSPEAAKSVYDAVDGTEYLTTANFFDLRFIPDELAFDDDVPRDECESIPDGYRPNPFVTDALQHSKVKLTWDADDGARKEVVRRAFGGSRQELQENDLRAYLGSESEDEEQENEPDLNKPDDVVGDSVGEKAKVGRKEQERAKLRAALGLEGDAPSTSKGKKEKAATVGDMQITFSSGLSSGAVDTSTGLGKRSIFENEPIVKETTVEKYVRQERDRKQKRREKAKAAREGTSPSSMPAASSMTDRKNPKSKPAKSNRVTVPNPNPNGNDDDNDNENDNDDKNDHAIINDTKNNDPPSPTPDLGFEDPFFTTPDLSSNKTNKSTQKRSKEERLALKAARTASAVASAQEKAALSLLMTDDPNLPSSTTNAVGTALRAHGAHFSLESILAAEKAAAKSKKKFLSKRKRQLLDDIEQGRAEEAGLQPGFEMDVKDPRFNMVYEGGTEWSVDPANPRFLGTEGMRKVLDEGRRRRREVREGGGVDGAADGEGVGKEGKNSGSGTGVGEQDVKVLVNKIKRQKMARVVSES